MLDIKLIQNDFETLANRLKKKKVDTALIEQLREISLNLKTLRQELEELQAVQNAKSKEMGIKAKTGEDISELKEQLTKNKALVSQKNEIVRSLEEELYGIALSKPEYD